jgi:hypothetical protein
MEDSNAVNVLQIGPWRRSNARSYTGDRSLFYGQCSYSFARLP